MHELDSEERMALAIVRELKELMYDADRIKTVIQGEGRISTVVLRIVQDAHSEIREIIDAWDADDEAFFA
jgi:hypothetical protein